MAASGYRKTPIPSFIDSSIQRSRGLGTVGRRTSGEACARAPGTKNACYQGLSRRQLSFCTIRRAHDRQPPPPWPASGNPFPRPGMAPSRPFPPGPHSGPRTRLFRTFLPPHTPGADASRPAVGPNRSRHASPGPRPAAPAANTRCISPTSPPGLFNYGCSRRPRSSASLHPLLLDLFFGWLTCGKGYDWEQKHYDLSYLKP